MPCAQAGFARRYRARTDAVDLVVVFRRSEEVPGIADAALAKGVPAFWTQLGVRHPEALARLRAEGVQVVEDRCTMVEHRSRLA